MINAIQTALSGLIASMRKVEASASNIANLNTSGALSDPDNAPYRAVITRQTAVTGENGQGLGVKSATIPKTTPFVPAFDPDSPFANEEGLIGAPNVNLAEEAVNIKLAETAYKANIKVLETIGDMEEALISAFDSRE